MSKWRVYIVECVDKTFYTGITTDTQRRLEEHNSDTGGARYTRMRRPVKLVFEQSFLNRSMACKREFEIKQLSRKQKAALIAKTHHYQANITIKKTGTV